MTLATTGRSRERILAFGMEGVGKSDAILDIAARVHPNRVFIIDNDNAWDRMLEGRSVSGGEGLVSEEYRWDQALRGGKGDWVFDDRWAVEGGNVVVYHVDGWEGNIAAIQSVMEEAGPDDWCGIDSGSALWDDVQAWFTENVFDATKADYFMQIRMEKAKSKDDDKALGALDGWVDWPVINAQYKQAVMKFLVNPPCHLFITAEQAEVSSGNVRGKALEDADTRALYGKLHVKPRAQKRMGHNVQTVLNLQRKASGDYVVNTVKDRGGREQLEGYEVTGAGFCDWYLQGVAGWQEQAAAPPVAVKKAPAKKVAPSKIAKKVLT